MAKARVTKKKTKMPSESSMMAELCEKHGYTFMANKAGRRTTMMFSKKMKVVTPMYTMVLAVPMGSELAKKMIEQFPVKTGKKT